MSDAATAGGGRLSFGDRFSDRCNPILVREVQQALNSRVFLVTMALSLVAILALALSVAIEGDISENEGRMFFVAGLDMLVPVILFVIPLQAFLSMRQEVTGGTAEQLLMSNLSPGRIVRGRLFASLVQFVLYLGVFAPALALTFLLRGVSVPMVAFMLGMGLLSCLAATSVAVALGAMCRWPYMSTFPLVICGVLLGGASIGVMAGMWDIVRELDREISRAPFLSLVSLIVTGGTFGFVLCSMVAASVLTHPYENRSTGFRVVALAAIVAGFVWFVIAAPMSPSVFRWAGPGYAAVLAACAVPFWLFAVTEDGALSPRVRTLVPKSRFLAAIAVPFLPGGARGIAFLLLLGVVSLGAGLGLCWIAGAAPDRETLGVALLGWLYALFYALLTWRVRTWVPAGPIGNWIGRLALPLVVGALCAAPVLFDVFALGRVRSWHWGHLLNFGWTIERHWRDASGPIVAMIVLDVVLLVTSARQIAAGAGEVLWVSEQRRTRAA